jgi:oligopeptide/dipeptide ABC transporter ATP-binding protein
MITRSGLLLAAFVFAFAGVGTAAAATSMGKSAVAVRVTAKDFSFVLSRKSVPHGRVEFDGDIPSPVAPPAGCRFHTRCRYATEICRTVEPPLVSHGGGHLAACHHPLNVGGMPPFAAGGRLPRTRTLPAAA